MKKIPGLMGDIEGGGKQQIMSTTCVLTEGREPEWSNPRKVHSHI